MKLYTCIILCAIASIAQAMSAEEKAQFRKSTVEECGKKLGSKKEDIAAVVNKEKELKEPSKCILECMLKKFGLIDRAGKLSVEGAKQAALMMYPNNDGAVKIAEEIANKCIAEQVAGDSACEIAFKYSACTRAELVARGIAPP